MIHSSLESIFPRARDLELAAGRRIWSLAVLFLVFHVSIVTPFVASSQRREAASRELDRLQGIEAELAALEPLIANSSNVAEEVMAPALDQLVDDVTLGLLRLRVTQRALRELVASQRGAESSGDVSGDDEDTELVEDDKADPAEPLVDDLDGIEPFQVENIDRILAVGEAETPEEMIAALRPLVDDRIVSPLFSDLKQLWGASAVPRIEASLDGVAGRIPELRGRFSESSEAWDALASALSAQRRAVRDLPWQPPERDDWWFAIVEDVVIPGLEPAIEEQLRGPLALDQFQTTALRTESSYRQVRLEVDGRFEALRLEAQSGGLPETVRRFGMARLARAFPLVLGLGLAAVILAAARRRRELGLLTHLLTERDGDGTLLDWYHQRSLWGLTTLSRAQAASAAWKASCLRLFALACSGFVWIGFAAAQLWDIEPPERLLVLTSFGAGVLFLALLYDFILERRLTGLLGKPLSPSRRVEQIETDEDGEPDGEPVSGRTLRR